MQLAAVNGAAGHKFHGLVNQVCGGQRFPLLEYPIVICPERLGRLRLDALPGYRCNQRPVVFLSQRKIPKIDAHLVVVFFPQLLKDFGFPGAIRTLEIAEHGDHHRGALGAEGGRAGVVNRVQSLPERVVVDLVNRSLDDVPPVFRDVKGFLLGGLAVSACDFDFEHSRNRRFLVFADRNLDLRPPDEQMPDVELEVRLVERVGGRGGVRRFFRRRAPAGIRREKENRRQEQKQQPLHNLPIVSMTRPRPAWFAAGTGAARELLKLRKRSSWGITPLFSANAL